MFGLLLDRSLSVPITVQLTQQLREAILSGKIPSGHKMPPTRQHAKELGISRNSVIQAYEQLIAEGYLISAVGSGTYAADIDVNEKYPRTTAKTGGMSVNETTAKDVIAFDPANPDLSVFPKAMWARMLKEACLDASPDDFGYGTPGGHPALIKAMANYLYRAKGIDCERERLFIVPGTSAGIELIARLLYTPGGGAVTEDPCLDFARLAVEKSGLNIIPVEADPCGICTERLPIEADCRLIYVAPSHQYPLGGVLPAKRRIALLEYARMHSAYVIEDDYDSEFRYRGEPIQSLWHLDSERVIHLGSLSNVFSPALRIAYIIVPSELADPVRQLMHTLHISMNAIEQMAVARVMETKLLDRHVYQMKKRYEAKRKHTIACLNAAFGSAITISGDDAGLYLMVTFPRRLTQQDFVAFEKAGIDADYVEDYALIKGRHENQLVIGFGNLSMEMITQGVARLKEALNEE